jgi:hypothetical protein
MRNDKNRRKAKGWIEGISIERKLLKHVMSDPKDGKSSNQESKNIIICVSTYVKLLL